MESTTSSDSGFVPNADFENLQLLHNVNMTQVVKNTASNILKSNPQHYEKLYATHSDTNMEVHEWHQIKNQNFYAKVTWSFIV